MRLGLTAFAAVAALTLTAAAQASSAAQVKSAACVSPITACGCAITAPGIYVLGGPLTESAANADCIDIKAHNVELDTLGAPNDLSGPGVGTGAGIRIEKSARSVTLGFAHGARGFGSPSVISGFGVGIFVEGDNAAIEGGQVDSNVYDGILFRNVASGLVDGLELSSNGDTGIEIESSSGVYVTGVTADANGSGLLLTDDHSVNVTASEFSNSTQDGVVITGGAGNIFDSAGADNNKGNGIVLSDSRGNVIGAASIGNNGNYGLWINGSSGNSMSESTAQGNGRAGVYIGCAPTGGPTGSACTPKVKPSTGNRIVSSNLSGSNGTGIPQPYGIVIDAGNSPNLVNLTQADGNSADDAFDANPGCGTNRWSNNLFTATTPTSCGR